MPGPILQRAADAVAQHKRRHELLPLYQLASEFHMHVRTLQAAVRTGRLEARFSARSVFGRPLRFATRGAVEEFKRQHYRRYVGQERCPAPLTLVPSDYADRLKNLRYQLQLTQGALAQPIGAAGKAVIYQWESGKRTPSPVFWERIENLTDLRSSVIRKTGRHRALPSDM